MFRTLVLSVPFALLPLAAVQLVETLLTRSLLPHLAESMQRAAAPVPEAATPALPAAPKMLQELEEAALVLPSALRF